MMEEIKEIKQPFSFTGTPSIIEEAKENAWQERKSFSEVVEELIIKYNSSKKKEKSKMIKTA